MKLPTAVDFETDPIEPRPQFPPKPVSVAIIEPGRKPEFWAWGHPVENNCTKAQAKKRLRELWKGSGELLFHEAAFDLDVAEVHFDLTRPAWHRVHDTIFQIFLADPNAEALNLKDAAEVYLGWPQEDQEPLRKWILANVPEAKRKPASWAAWLSRLPGNMAAKRALGDVKRTLALHKAFHSPSEAYDRERRFLDVRLSMERQGMPVDVRGLEEDVKRGNQWLGAASRWIERRIQAPGVLPSQRERFADALEDAGLVEERIYTEPSKTHPDGQRSTSYESLREVCKDRELVEMVSYWSILKTQVRTFAEPWLHQARETNGRVYVRFNQVRSASAAKRKQVGARTGRLSSEPNLMNVPSAQPKIVRSLSNLLRSEKTTPSLLVAIRGGQLLDLRSRVVAPRGYLLGDHDYSQQELRILAHLGGGRLVSVYNKDPYADAHKFVGGEIAPLIGRVIPHRDVKAVDFGVLYGEGLDLLATKLHCDRSEAMKLRRLCKSILGAQEYDAQLKRQGYCVTVGGRHCPVEEPKFVKGQYRTWEYKLLNTAIQGSAADQLKEAMILIEETFPGIILLSVHDEILWHEVVRLAKALVKDISRLMEEAIPLRVPVISQGKTGRTWRECH